LGAGLVTASAVAIPLGIVLSKPHNYSHLLRRQANVNDITMVKDEITNSYDYKINSSFAYQQMTHDEKQDYIRSFHGYIDEIVTASRSVGMSVNTIVDRLGEEALDDQIKVLDYKAADRLVDSIKKGLTKNVTPEA
jgi:hypothetical protein